MALPHADEQYLADRGLEHQVSPEQKMTCVVIQRWALPAGYNATQADLLLRLGAGYPDVAPDMWWFDPPLHRTDGKTIPATDVIETHVGRQWQRWSRHFNGGQWQSGIDGLESYLALIRRELERCCGVEASI